MREDSASASFTEKSRGKTSVDLSPSEQDLVRQGMESLGWEIHYFDVGRRKPHRCYRCAVAFAAGDYGYERQFQGYEGGNAMLYCCVSCAAEVCRDECVFGEAEEE